MADPRNFLLNSDYPIPPLLFYQTYQFAVTATQQVADLIVPHGLPFTPLLVGMWSNSSNFQPSYDASVDLPNYTTSMPEQQQLVGADATNIYFSLYNNTGSDLTFFYRLAAFAPPEFTGDVAPLYDASNFIFNFENNYLKLLKQGKTTVPAGGAVNIPHNLGFLPQCRIWQESSPTSSLGVTAYTPAPSTINDDGTAIGPSIDTQNLVLSSNTQFAGANTFYYHIYADEV